ncbi:MAG: IS630 family transposase [Chitinivibrionales bacterium]|nr:IS630 family transposase [Chitinivibrionales bacterium]
MPRVIAHEFGVSYHPNHVSRILKKLGWTPQKPITKASRRDERSIEHWRKVTWPTIKKKAHLQGQRIVFIDESGFYLLPGVVRTYGLRGHTPELRVHLTRDHLAAITGISSEGHLYSLIRKGPISKLDTIIFLRHLLRCIKRKLLIIWDGSPIHLTFDVKWFLANDASRRIHVEFLPPYAPDINPAEGVWNYLKNVELRNLSCSNLDHLHSKLSMSIEYLRFKPRIIFFRA